MTKFRKGLIRYFRSLPPLSKPCAGTKDCPIAVFRKATGHKVQDNFTAMRYDLSFAEAIDSGPIWRRLTAAQIAKVAESLK